MPSKKRATPISLQPLDGMQIKKEDYKLVYVCLLYTSDAADEEDSVGIGGSSIIKKKKM